LSRHWENAAGRVHERLGEAAGLRPVVLGEGRRFALWELASLAEGALGERVEPDALIPSAERRLRARLGSIGREYPDDGRFRRRYWLVGGGGVPVGTVALDTWPKGSGQLGVSSLYVRPSERRAGLAWAALDVVYRATLAEGLRGFRLDAHWTWQDAVRYYLARGLWVVSWKHDLGFARMPGLPRYEVRDEGDRLVLLVEEGRVLTPLLSARRERSWLRLEEMQAYRRLAADRPGRWVDGYARSTLAVHLAVRGWPLVRSAESWAQAWQWSDIGEPEGLAYKIDLFEETASSSGWRVDTAYRRVPLPLRPGG
jgi:hypothetical protein